MRLTFETNIDQYERRMVKSLVSLDKVEILGCVNYVNVYSVVTESLYSQDLVMVLCTVFDKTRVVHMTSEQALILNER